MTIETMSQCSKCRHFIEHKGDEPGCAAFPDGIPMPIGRNEHDHTKPYPGDNDIQFEQWVPEAQREEKQEP